MCDIIYNPVSQFFKGLVAQCFFLLRDCPMKKCENNKQFIRFLSCSEQNGLEIEGTLKSKLMLRLVMKALQDPRFLAAFTRHR